MELDRFPTEQDEHRGPVTRSRVVANGSGLSTAPPSTLGQCFTPRSLVEAFGPYATLDVTRRNPDRIVGVGIIAVAAAALALVVAGVIR